jgi:hypothetical protein
MVLEAPTASINPARASERALSTAATSATGGFGAQEASRWFFGKLGEDLLELGGGAVASTAGADAGESIDFERVDHFGQRLYAVGRYRDEDELVADAEELSKALRRQGGPTEYGEGFVWQ